MTNWKISFKIIIYVNSLDRETPIWDDPDRLQIDDCDMTYSEVAKYRANVGLKLDKEGLRCLMGFWEISNTSLLAKVKFFTIETSIIEACHQERIMLLTCVMIHWRIRHDSIRMMGNLNTL